ncbi:hypothetical protein [Myxococcus qinghaiensis]|uniref:hypothetical protein n=1 Tax=Myxococcus qinghaiensis TaxID=2906758 RepID=UPI0020A6EADF|nr:hypothetical protein [Myxococcus qinghaiensis]MCP3168875.1 hypothetical protein [Myxococcus qinghaiensis]
MEKDKVVLMDALSRMQKDCEAGRLAMHIGSANAYVLVGFVAGYLACLDDNGIQDTEYSEFSLWLHDEKNEFPSEGWASKYLRDFNGDHLAAIQKYLGFVAEFRARRVRSP